MKKYTGILFLAALMVLQFSQPASARTDVAVSFVMPGLCLDVSNARPSPHHVWVDGCRYWNGRTHVWVPGHWRYAPVKEVVYVAPRHDRFRDRYYRHDYRDRDGRYGRSDTPRGR